MKHVQLFDQGGISIGMSSKPKMTQIDSDKDIIEDNMLVNVTNEFNTDEDEDGVFSERKLAVRMFFLAVCHIFMLSSRQPVWILYAKQFNNTSYNLTSKILFAGLLWKGIIGLITVSLANKYGYVKSVLILLCVVVFAIFLECIATNIIILSIGFFLSQVGIINIVLACIAWLLPHKIAVNYTSYLFSAIVMAYLLGPVAAGAIAHFVDYRWVFWINFIFGIVTIIYALKFIPFDIQKKIEQKQLKTMIKSKKNENINEKKRAWKTIHNEQDQQSEQTKKAEEIHSQEIVEYDEDEMYPICLMKLQNKNTCTPNNSHPINPFKNINLSKYEWFMLIASIISTMWIPFCEGIISIYYCLYVIDKVRGGNIMNGSIQLLLMAIGVIIGKLNAPKFIRNMNKNYKILNKYILLLLASLLIIFLAFFVYPNSETINMLYLYAFLFGILFGIFAMTAQILLLEFQPSSHAGYIKGIKVFFSSFIRAFGLLIVGLQWEKHHNIMYYVISMSMLMAFCLCLTMTIIQKNLCKKSQPSSSSS